jgi:hypothetical protein
MDMDIERFTIRMQDIMLALAICAVNRPVTLPCGMGIIAKVRQYREVWDHPYSVFRIRLKRLHQHPLMRIFLADLLPVHEDAPALFGWILTQVAARGGDRYDQRGKQARVPSARAFAIQKAAP